MQSAFYLSITCVCVCVCVIHREDVRTANVVATEPVTCLVIDRE